MIDQNLPYRFLRGQPLKSARHQHDTERAKKKNGIVAIDSCFALFGARQYGVTTRDQALMKNYPRTLILALTQNSEHPQNYAIPRVFWGARAQVSS